MALVISSITGVIGIAIGIFKCCKDRESQYQQGKTEETKRDKDEEMKGDKTEEMKSEAKIV